MKTSALFLLSALLLCVTGYENTRASIAAPQPATTSLAQWPTGLPVYDHIVIVVDENKDYEQIAGSAAAPYLNGTLKAEGANLTRMYAEEHRSQGNYFWLFSGSNQNAGFNDEVPDKPLAAGSLGEQLIHAGLSFKGYCESLPEIGWSGNHTGLYARKHAPWISFSSVPNGSTVATSSNLRFRDFPADYGSLPVVSFVIPNLRNDMHHGSPPASVTLGDQWLREHLDGYYQWAKLHNSLLIVTFDEDNHGHGHEGLTNPADPKPARRNRIFTILAGAHVKPGDYAEGKGVTHVNLLRTLEAMYGLPRSGAQQKNAVNAGIADDFVITDVFEGGR
jgi:hypothetical protein